MGVIRLGVCISGVYGAFLLWAIAQERLSAPFQSTSHHLHPHSNTELGPGDKFPSPLILNYAQALASCVSAFAYLLFNAWRAGDLGKKGLWEILGFNLLFPPHPPIKLRKENESNVIDKTKLNGELNGHSQHVQTAQSTTQQQTNTPWRKSLLGLLLQVSLCQTTAGPIGFLTLRHISYPTMVLGKSCKLIPVLVLNVILYRRKFASHKYLVVALVTIGISMFMLLADSIGKKKKGGSNSLWGLGLLGVNLFIDGLTNSTQDQIFSTYHQFTGQQMMFMMSLFTQILLAPLLVLPLPSHPLSLLTHLPTPLSGSLASTPITFSPPALITSIQFLITHPTATAPLLAYALLGGLGQLFIFETIQHFGSLTLVMVTVTRKLFTMLLSVIVFEHTLTKGQWMGVGVVFAGIGVEAGIKRRDMMRRARRDRT